MTQTQTRNNKQIYLKAWIKSIATEKRIYTIVILLHSKYASYLKTLRVLLRSSTLYTHHNTSSRSWGVVEFI